MNIEELVGSYTIIGSNQDGESNVYKGMLLLSLDDNKRIIAKWTINKTMF